MKGQFFSRALVYFSLCMAWLTACSDESSVITNVSYSGIEAVSELEHPFIPVRRESGFL